MIEGVLRHATTMSVEQQYVDSHGQSEVAFTFLPHAWLQSLATAQEHPFAEALSTGTLRQLQQPRIRAHTRH